jgi:hypothetical protein
MMTFNDLIGMASRIGEQTDSEIYELTKLPNYLADIRNIMEWADRPFMVDGIEGNYLDEWLGRYGSFQAVPIDAEIGTAACRGRGIFFKDDGLRQGHLSAWIPYSLGYESLEAITPDIEACYRLGVNPLPTLRQQLKHLPVQVVFGIMNSGGGYVAEKRSATLVVYLDNETGDVSLDLIDWYADSEACWVIRRNKDEFESKLAVVYETPPEPMPKPGPRKVAQVTPKA